MSNEQVRIQQIENRPEQTADVDSLSVSAEKMKSLGDRLSKRLNELRTDRVRREWDEDRAEDFRAYFLMEPTKDIPYDGYPNLRCVLPRIITDTFHANVIFTFSGQEGEFKVLPKYLNAAHISTADKAAKYLTYVLNEEAGFYEAFDKADWDANVFGVGYLEPKYVREFAFETRKVTKEINEPIIDPVTGQVRDVKRRKTTTTERVKKTKFDGVKIEALDVESVYSSPLIEDLEKAVKVDTVFKMARHLFSTIKSKAKSIDGQKPFFLPGQVSKLKQFVSNRLLEEDKSLLKQVQEEYDGHVPEHLLDSQFLDLVEAHLWDDVDNDGWPEKILVTFEAKSGLVLRVSLVEFRIVELKPRPVRGRFQGESIRKAGAPLFSEWEAIHNARVAKGQWANLPIMFYTAGGRFNPETITLVPGQGYPVDDARSITFPQMGQVDVSFFNEERLLLDYVERIFATGEAIQGVTQRGDTSATETITVQQRAGIRLQNPMQRIAKSLGKLLGHIWDLNRICAPESKEFRVLGSPTGAPLFSRITREDYTQQLQFKVDMATVADVQLARDTALLAWRTFSQDPAFIQAPAARDSLLRRTFDSLNIPLIGMPKPEQAQVISPEEERELLRRDEEVEPKLGSDPDEHIRNHNKFMTLKEFAEDWTREQKIALITLLGKYDVQKNTLQSGGLNNSGIPNQQEGGSIPSLTANRNPTQTFNTMRVGETLPSQRQNLRNGIPGV